MIERIARISRKLPSWSCSDLVDTSNLVKQEMFMVPRAEGDVKAHAPALYVLSGAVQTRLAAGLTLQLTREIIESNKHFFREIRAIRPIAVHSR